jgi:hypothetical protein
MLPLRTKATLLPLFGITRGQMLVPLSLQSKSSATAMALVPEEFGPDSNRLIHRPLTRSQPPYSHVLTRCGSRKKKLKIVQLWRG